MNWKRVLNLAITLAVLTALALSGVVWADDVANNLDDSVDATLETATIYVGESISVGFKIVADSGGGGVAGCNVDTNYPAYLEIKPPDKVLLNGNTNSVTLTFTSCGIFQYVTFSSNTAGSYQIGNNDLSISGGRSGSKWDLNPARFNLIVNARPTPTPTPIPDTTPPVITYTINGTLGNNGWYVSDVTVTWTVTDSESAITSKSGCDETTITTDTSGTTLTCKATSAGGEASASVIIKRDATPPTISASVSPARPDSGWWNIDSGAPTVSFTCSDALSGLAGDCPDDYTFEEGENQSYSQTIYDKAGNSASAGVSDIDVDLTAPTITATLDKSPASTGWFNASTGAPTVSFTCSDNLSGLAGACPDDYTFGEGKGQSYSQTIYDNAGNSASAEVSDIDVDLTAPTITATLDKSPASTGWFNASTGAPTVSFTCSDNLSGLAGDCPDDYTFEEGENQSYSQTIYDKAGNSATATVEDVDVDLTAPTISASVSPARPDSGWWNIDSGAPTVSFTCSDNLSGLAGACPADYTFGEGENQSYSQTIYDNAGNSASAEVSDIDVDLTAPTITWSSEEPANGASYYFGFVPAAPTCTASDELSGVDGACTISGYGTAVGSHTLTAKATDKAGNIKTEERTYTVLTWTLKGFYQPVDMNGVFNVVKGGSTVPLKFEIFAGATELTDTAAVYALKYGETACNANAVTDEIETVATGGTSLRYDWTAGQFIFNWKTPTTSGKCYRVTMTTQDGSILQAFFKIK